MRNGEENKKEMRKVGRKWKGERNDGRTEKGGNEGRKREEGRKWKEESDRGRRDSE